MAIMPELPGCGQPATIRLEIYSAANGTLYGSLDASVYACDLHGIEAVSAIQTAGLTAYRVPLAPDAQHTCGHVHVYPAGALAGEVGQASADLQHPRWCDRKNCERRGEHRSPARQVDTNQPEALIVGVALVQNVHPAAEPMVSLTGIDGVGAAEPVATHLLLSIGQASVLTYIVRQLIDASKGGRR